MSDVGDAIKSSFSPLEKKAHDVLKNVLWVLYPTPETTIEGASYEDDIVSDECAAMLIDSLKTKGFELIERDEPYISPAPTITDDEIEKLMKNYPKELQ